MPAVPPEAVLGSRIQAVLSMAGIAPYGADGLDWFAGMVPSGVAALGTAAAGRAARTALEASGFAYDCEFTSADLALFEEPWGWLGKVGQPALAAGPYGQIDDDVSYTLGWGCDPGAIGASVLLLHGSEDRIIPASHGLWLAGRCPTVELRLCQGDSHFTIVITPNPVWNGCVGRSDGPTADDSSPPRRETGTPPVGRTRSGPNTSSPSRRATMRGRTDAEEAVVLAAQPGHLGADVVFGELSGLAVEGFDSHSDGEVLIGDGAAGDFLWRSQVLPLSECLSCWDVIGADWRHGWGLRRLTSERRFFAPLGAAEVARLKAPLRILNDALSAGVPETD